LGIKEGFLGNIKSKLKFKERVRIRKVIKMYENKPKSIEMSKYGSSRIKENVMD
jgi:hypothetical protein